MSRRPLGLAFGLVLALSLVAGHARPARAQAVGFFPQIAEFPNGINLNTTPVVSADRRYVRIGVDVGFTAIDGFTNVSVPAAVSGGGGAGGGLGGGGGGGGGGRVAGMNGIVNPGRNQGPLIAYHGYGNGNGGSPDAAALVGGYTDDPSGYGYTPSLSAGMPDEPRRPATASKAVKKKATRKPATRKRR